MESKFNHHKYDDDEDRSYEKFLKFQRHLIFEDTYKVKVGSSINVRKHYHKELRYWLRYPQLAKIQEDYKRNEYHDNHWWRSVSNNEEPRRGT